MVVQFNIQKHEQQWLLILKGMTEKTNYECKADLGMNTFNKFILFISPFYECSSIIFKIQEIFQQV